MHTEAAKKLLQGFIKKGETVSRVETEQQRDLRLLKEDMTKEGLFRPRLLHEVPKVQPLSEVLFTSFLRMSVVCATSQSFSCVFMTFVLFALYFF